MASFRTKSERVVVTDDEIRVESGLLVQARRYWEGSKILFFFIYVLSPVGILLFGYEPFVEGDWETLFIALGFGITVYLALRLYDYRYRGYSPADRIPLDAVERVTVSEGSSNPRFVVKFREDGDRKRKLLLMASGRFDYGPEAMRRAEEIFRERGIPVETLDSRNIEPQTAQQ